MCQCYYWEGGWRFLCDWLCVFTSKQTNGWNRRILQEPCNHNALDLLFDVFWRGRVTGASTTWSPDDTILPTPPFNATITLTLVFWQVSKPAFDQEFTSQMTWRQMMMMMQCTAGRELDERACCGDCVRARAYSCAWVTDSDRVELRRSELSSDKVYSVQEASGGVLKRYQPHEWGGSDNVGKTCVLLVLVLRGNFLVEAGRRSKSVCNLAAPVQHGV